jgi:alkylhydroperoxidase/carboxymuconolactone decarboxylase family protein YurZ
MISVPSDIYSPIMNTIDPKTLTLNSLALLLAVRCKSKEATKQLLGRFYHQMSEKQAKTFMNRTIMLLEPKERDWLKNLC